MSSVLTAQNKQDVSVSSTVVRYRTINVDESGSSIEKPVRRRAPMLLLVHGFPSASPIFRNLIPQLAAASD